MKRSLLLAPLLALLPACSGLAVDADYDPAVDFTAFQSYAWLDSEPPQTAELVQGDLLHQRIEAAAGLLLAAVGMERLEHSERADVLIRASVVTRERVEAWSSTYGAGYGYGHPWWGGLPVYTDTTLAIYPETQVVIDFLLPGAAPRLVWRGIGELNTGRADSPLERTERVRETVAAILAQYPPGG
ncbi:MAG: hypothetical protein CMJ94_07105 [Planctomycetes bacterium]|nr:hypothetical protein [Planctomycetota bacterium]